MRYTRTRMEPLHTLKALRLAGGHWTIVATHAGDEAVRAEPFEDVGLELGALWSEP
jgi:hypothetical protein